MASGVLKAQIDKRLTDAAGQRPASHLLSSMVAINNDARHWQAESQSRCRLTSVSHHEDPPAICARYSYVPVSNQRVTITAPVIVVPLRCAHDLPSPQPPLCAPV